MQKTITVYSFSKINLFLEVESLREDRYHNIYSYVMPLDFADKMIITEHKSPKITFSSDDLFLNQQPLDELTIGKAIKVLEPYKKKDFYFHLHLEKRVPYGTGLGIASSNASRLLKVLNEVWDCHLSTQQLSDLSSLVGSDCPMFFHDSLMLCQEKGNKITEIAKKPLKYPLLLMIPKEIKINTKESYDFIKDYQLYSRDQKKRSQFEDFFNNWDHQIFTQEIYNTFENRLLDQYEIYKNIRECLKPYAFCFSLTGSGSAYYALFENKNKIETFLNHNYKKIKKNFDLLFNLL